MLYELIQSMTQSEKRYFKLHASRLYKKKELPLIELFDIIAQQSSYNEELVKSSFDSDFFAQKKKVLYDKVLDSLKSFHKGSNAHSQLDDFLATFRILLSKSVYKQAHKTLKQARKLAEKYELFTELIRINQAETEFYVATANTATLQTHIVKMRKEIPRLVQLLDDRQIIENTYVNFVKVNSEREFVRSKLELKSLEASANQIIHLDADKVESFHVKILAYYTKGVFYYLSGDLVEGVKWFEKQIAAFEKQPQFSSELQFELARALANCALLSLRTEDPSSFDKCFSQLMNISGKTRRLNNQLNYWRYVLKFSYMVKKGSYNEAIMFSKTSPLIDKLEIEFETENVLVTERYLMLFGKVQAYMILGQNKDALQVINAFLNSPSSDDKQDAFIFIRFLFLFVHLELDNTDIVENGLRSLERYLKQKGRLFEFEEHTLKLLSGLCETNEKRLAADSLRKYQRTLLDLKKDSFERNATINFDLVQWLEYKLSDDTK